MKIDRYVHAKSLKCLRDEIVKICNDALKTDGLVHVVFESNKRPRTTGERSQNTHLNGHIQEIAKETGQPFEDIKKYVKQQAISRGYPIKMIYGNPFLDAWGNVVGISESEASVEECSLLIEQAHQLASELGIILKEDA